MIVAERLRAVPEQKQLSQGDVEKRTGLLRCYLSRVENGHTVQAVETLEKIARAFDMSFYQLLYDGDSPPEPRAPLPGDRSNQPAFGASRREHDYLQKLTRSLAKMTESDRQILLHLTKGLVARSAR
jgi:transcriptional regulator with XRE-family HTH domain